MDFFWNADRPAYGQPFGDFDRRIVGHEAPAEVRAWLTLCPRYRPTPLHELKRLASELGIGRLWVKDEGDRLGLGSFKALGGAYAVMRIAYAVAERTLGSIKRKDLLSEPVRKVCQTLTFGCATDGNHGKSVAAGARLIGAASKVFIHAGVSAAKASAIADCGAGLVRVAGSYDDSVAEARRQCDANGWHLVADGSWPGYEEVPGQVMQGYTVIADEILSAIAGPPTHVFLQAGVGGFAAAIAGHLRERLGENSPRVVVVEPERAACVLASARAGALVRIPDSEPTVMAMLECYDASLVAWRILERCAEAFIALPEAAAARAVKLLARPVADDPSILSGESGAAGLAGLLAVAENDDHRRRLCLDNASRVLVISTETASGANQSQGA